MQRAKSKKNDLKGKQSERTTFKIANVSLMTVKSLARKNKISQKDVLIAAIQGITSLSGDSDYQKKQILYLNKLYFQEAGVELVRKTLVLNKESLSLLEEYAKKFAVSRDLLLDYVIHILFTKTYAENAYSLVEMELDDTFFWSMLDHVSGGSGQIVDVVKKHLNDYPDLQKEILKDLDELDKIFNEKVESIENKLKNCEVNKIKMIKGGSDEYV